MITLKRVVSWDTSSVAQQNPYLLQARCKELRSKSQFQNAQTSRFDKWFRRTSDVYDESSAERIRDFKRIGTLFESQRTKGARATYCCRAGWPVILRLIPFDVGARSEFQATALCHRAGVDSFIRRPRFEPITTRDYVAHDPHMVDGT
ncbi:hypothetical protein EVAR_44657_1 [Eumeta japonica]|uniref:Uncharacterized protein n=1 Tax=Eumeta variegata TaxID=151549 RepID=A0A4C1XIX0_EUMVA|nr:hypothetical protein EVAR_44657_1 [Eumeta japonica]